MIAICICILCAIIIFLTWRLEKVVRKADWFECELFATQVELDNLRSDVEDLKYKQ